MLSTENPRVYFNYFNFFYYIGICPFRFKYHIRTGTFRIRTNGFVKLFAGLTTIATFIEPIQRLHESIFKQSVENSKLSSNGGGGGGTDLHSSFDVIVAFATVFYLISYCHVLWSKSPELCSILTFFQLPEYEYFYKRFNSTKSKCSFVILLLIWVLSIGSTVNNLIIEAANYSWSLETTAAEKKSTAILKIFFMKTNLTNWLNINNNNNGINNSLLDAGSVGLEDDNEVNNNNGLNGFGISVLLLTTLFHIVYKLSQELMTRFGDWLLVSMALVLYGPVNIFCTQILADTTGTSTLPVAVFEVRQYYETLKLLSQNINEAIGELVLVNTIGSIPLFCMSLMNILNPENPLVFLRDGMYFVSYYLFVYLAICIDQKMKIFEVWLSKNYLRLDRDEALILLNELKSSEIGFHAMGLFKISAGILGSMIHLVVSFTIIYIQSSQSVASC